MTSDKSQTITPIQEQDICDAINLVLAENQKVLTKVKLHHLTQLSQLILDRDRIFIAGEGRSGLAIQMTAMRLMHLGLEVHVVGEVTAPSIESRDLLIVCSGSGSTHGAVDVARTAKKIGAKIVTITTQKESALGNLADLVIQLDAATKKEISNSSSKQFAGSLFEQSTLLLFDALFYVLAHHLHQSNAVLMSRHTNLE